MSERTRTAYGEWARDYDSDPNPQLALEEEEVMRLLDLRPGLRILDAACGTGRYARRIAPGGAGVVGLDFSRPMLERARAAGMVDLVEADLGALPLADRSFDRVLCAQALKHLPALVPVVAELARVLRPGGVLLFSVTHPDMDWKGYEMRETPAFILPERADVHHHRFCDYLDALDRADLRLDAIRQLAVDRRIAHLLTPASFAQVRGRFQVVVFRAVR